MKKFIFFIMFLTNLLSYEIVNGDIEILEISKDSVQSLRINGKEKAWLKSPANSDKMIAIISSNYRNDKDIVVKHGDETLKFSLKKGEYKKEQISVASSKVNLSKENSDRVKKEANEAYKIYAKNSGEFKFNSKFILPLNSTITSNFGNARVFNGSLRSYHSGTDFRAVVGTPVKAVNDGVVVIAKDRFYAGKSVVIDHGGGIYSQYYHLSKMNFKVGEMVKKGDIVGLSGDSGRVSGAHLHFGIVVDSNSVEPLKFIEKFNSLFEN